MKEARDIAGRRILDALSNSVRRAAIGIAGILILGALSNFAYSTNYYSILDGFGFNGNWSDGNYWSLTSGGAAAGSTPGQFDDIYIEEDMTLDQDFTVRGSLTITGAALTTTNYSLAIRSGASLTIASSLQVLNLTFYNGSTIDISASSTVDVLGDFTNNNNSNDVTIDGTVNVTGEFNNGTGGIVTGTGNVTAGSYTGDGTTFGFSPSEDIEDGATYPDPLPIELISFTAETNDDGILVNWSTATEINNDYFTIERSSDGEYFEELEYIQGAGNSNFTRSYTYMNINPYEGISYYRLKQTDFDGKYEYFNMVAVEYKANNSFSMSAVNLYPNPVNRTSNPFVTIENLMPEKNTSIIIRNMQGIEVYQLNTITNLQGIVRIPIALDNRLSEGIYMIIIVQENEMKTEQLVIK